MLRILSKKEQNEHRKELNKFVKENPTIMYNYMRDVKNFIRKGKETERKRIIREIKKLEISHDIKKKVIEKIMEEQQKQFRAQMKKYGVVVKKHKNQQL